MKQNVFRKPSGIIVSLLLVFFLLLPVSPVLCAAPAADPSSDCLSSGWPHDQSDLQPDPSLVFGRLDNGLRYVFMANDKPKDRVALYLNVQAGSMHETEEQRGVAHFLEHMLFNGTTHYPPGTLVEYFQSIGMGFGGDTNAHTGFDETVYNLLLPSGTPKVLEKGLSVLADYARGALLLPEEVERERGIILAEKRTRDSAASRVSKEQMQFDFAGTLLAQRDPIGTEKVLHSADSRLLRSFYDRWYRPENMMVVAVGDMEPKEAEKLLKQYFSTLKGVGEIGECAPFGAVQESGTVVHFYPEPELGYANVALTTVFNTQPRPDTLAWEIEQLRQYVAVSMLANRLDILEQKTDSPLAQPGAMAGIIVQRVGYATLATRTEPGKWQQGLTLLQTTLAQALQNGFSERELSRAKREIAAYLEKAVQTASSRDSREIAGQIIRKLNNNEVILSPAQEMTLYHPVLEKLTLEEVNSAFRQLWSRPRRLVAVAGAVDSSLTKGQAKEQISKVFHENEAKPVPPWVEEPRVTFPYLPVPSTVGTIVEHVQHKAIGVESYVVQGGVRVNIKSTDFQANQVLLSAQFGKGRHAEPVDGLGMLAEAVVRESGVGQLTREQLETALTGTNVALNFRVGPESFSWNGTSLSQELELLLQLVYCRLHDPAFRPEAYRRSRDNLHRMYEQLGNTVEGIQQMQGDRFLTGSSREYGLPPWEQVAQIQLEQISAWLKPEFSREPLEINIVGDIQPEEVLRLVTKYFGGEQRKAEEDTQGAAIVFPAGEQRYLRVNSSIDKALLTVSWQTGDYWDIGRTRRLNLLAAVLDDRLRVTIREELGATYSPQVVSQPSRVHAGFGLLTSRLTVAPDRAASLAKVIKKVAADLGTEGVNEDELRRALQPTLTSIKDIKRSNQYWLEAVLNLSSRHPQQLQWPLTITEGFAGITADELTALAKRYLQEKQAAMVVVAPADANRSDEPAATSEKVPAAKP